MGAPVRSVRWVDALTVSRAVAGVGLLWVAVSGRRNRQGVAAWIAWLALVAAAIPADWLDGPLARRLGPSSYGEVLDLEADSWLTLCTAVAATTWGGLPGFVALPAILRYPLVWWAMRRRPYSELNRGHPSWARPIGMAQMAIFIAALAPFGGYLTRRAARLAAPVVAAAQLATMWVLYGKRR
jgi:phosphatidylglycerophosphate synthase